MQKGVLECVADFIDGLGDVISEGFTVCLGAAPRQAAQFLQLTRTHRQYRHKNGTGSMCGDRSSRMCIWYMRTVSRPRGCRRMLDSGHGKAQIHLTAGWNNNCLTAGGLQHIEPTAGLHLRWKVSLLQRCCRCETCCSKYLSTNLSCVQNFKSLHKSCSFCRGGRTLAAFCAPSFIGRFLAHDCATTTRSSRRVCHKTLGFSILRPAFLE